MSDRGDNSPSETDTPGAPDRLDSWKEIAAYLRRGVSTVQRWEKEEGLPTHRLHHGKQGSVYAFKGELDAWMRDRRERVRDGGETESTKPEPEENDLEGDPTPAKVEDLPEERPDAPLPNSPGPASGPDASWRPGRVFFLGAAALLAAAWTIARLVQEPGSTASPSPAEIASPGPPPTVPVTSSRDLERHPALSPDGHRLAYVSNERTRDPTATFDLYVKDVDSPTALRLTASPEESECCPAWSPDGQKVAFLRLLKDGAAVLTMPATGGHAETLGTITPWFGSSLSYSPDGRFLAYSDRSAPGGPFVVKLRELATAKTLELTHASPDFSGDAFPKISPDGQFVALARLSSSAIVAAADIYVVPTGGGEPVRLTKDGRFVGDLDWMPDGKELLFNSFRDPGGLRFWKVPLTGGEPVLVWPGGDPVRPETYAEAFMDVSYEFRFSVARRLNRIALTKPDYDTNIFRVDPGAPSPSPSSPLIGSSAVDESPQYSPDGRRIAFSTTRSGRRQIWLCDSDGSGCAPIAPTPNGGTPRWSPDGRSIVYDAWSPLDNHADVYVVDVRTQQVRGITNHPADDVVPSFSRDGQSIYFASNRADGWQIYRTPVAGGEPRQITHEGGFAAFESPRGDLLFYTRFNLPGLFQVSRDGGDERPWLDRPRCWGHWAVAPEGVYVLDSREGQTTELEFAAFGERALHRVATLAQRPPCAESSLASSPDGRHLLYVGIEEHSDIVRVDGLR